MAKTLEQQIADAEARLARLREKTRKKETRQKIIVGAVVIAEALEDEKIAALLLKKIAAKVTRDIDKTDIAGLVAELKAVAEKQPAAPAAPVETPHE